MHKTARTPAIVYCYENLKIPNVKMDFFAKDRVLIVIYKIFLNFHTHNFPALTQIIFSIRLRPTVIKSAAFLFI